MWLEASTLGQTISGLLDRPQALGLFNYWFFGAMAGCQMSDCAISCHSRPLPFFCPGLMASLGEQLGKEVLGYQAFTGNIRKTFEINVLNLLYSLLNFMFQMYIAGFNACSDYISNYFQIQIQQWKLCILYVGEKLDFKMHWLSYKTQGWVNLKEIPKKKREREKEMLTKILLKK